MNIETLPPAQLDKLCMQLSERIQQLCNVVAGYEVDVSAKTKAYKRAQAKAAVMVDKNIPPSLAKMAIENDSEVIAAADALEQAQSLLIMGKAELAGVEAKYQGVKKIIDLKVSEIRSFRG